MMKFPKQQDIDSLRAFNEPHCLTIYVPLVDLGVEPNPTRIELKNLLREAETALADAGITQKIIKKTLRPAKDILKNADFWPAHRESLVLFLHPKMFQYYFIPEQNIPYMISVEKGFNLEPLLEIIEENKPYYVLALGHKKVQLYEGNKYELHPVRLSDFPTDMKEALHIDEYPSVRELHHIAPASKGKGSSAYHSQYDVKQTDKAMLLKFFRLIDKRLHGFMNAKKEPLILASVQYLQPMYRKVNTYPHIATGSIKGNVTRETLDNLRTKALLALSSDSRTRTHQQA